MNSPNVWNIDLYCYPVFQLLLSNKPCLNWMNEDGIFFTIAQDPAVNQAQVSPSVSDNVSWYSSHLGPRLAYLPVMGHPAHQCCYKRTANKYVQMIGHSWLQMKLGWQKSDGRWDAAESYRFSYPWFRSSVWVGTSKMAHSWSATLVLVWPGLLTVRWLVQEWKEQVGRCGMKLV